MAKEGSTVSGLMDSFATTVSVALQYGVPLQGPRQQVRPRPVRAERLHRQPGDPDRQVDRGLHLPVARARGSCSTDDKASLGLIDRSAIVDEAPRRRLRATPLRGSASRPSPSYPGRGRAPDTGGGIPETAEAVAPPAASEARPPTRMTPTATAAVASPRPPRRPRMSSRSSRPTATPTATRRTATAAAKANGNGGGDGAAPITLTLGATKVSFQTQADAPQLRRLRLDHGPQRQRATSASTAGAHPAAAEDGAENSRPRGRGRYHHPVSIEFLVTTLVIVVVTPGTGVLYTLAAGLSRGRAGERPRRVRLHARDRPAHARGDHGPRGPAEHERGRVRGDQVPRRRLPALHGVERRSRETGALAVDDRRRASIGAPGASCTGILINILNPKLTIFFFAFLPQFVAWLGRGRCPHARAQRRLHGRHVRGLRRLRRVRRRRARRHVIARPRVVTVDAPHVRGCVRRARASARRRPALVSR